MKVKQILPKLKANKYTYYNLSTKDILHFKNLYNYLKKHSDKKVSFIAKIEAFRYIKNKKELDFLNKINAMQIISTNIF